VFPDGTIIRLLPGEQVEPAKLKVAEKREIIVETERALRAVVREVYAARFRETAAQRIEEALPERERESLARALRARPAGSEPLSIVDYLYLSQLPCSSRRTLGRMLVAVWAVRRTESIGFSLPSARSLRFATRSPMSAKLIATASFARALHATTCWRCCKAGPESGTGPSRHHPVRGKNSRLDGANTHPLRST
jgi:hypothetical protein